jgi:hypothetical protein
MTIPLYLEINGNVGPFHPDLVKEWDSANIGDPCARCGTPLVQYGDSIFTICQKCNQELKDVRGCKCAGNYVCPVCFPDD